MNPPVLTKERFSPQPRFPCGRGRRAEKFLCVEPVLTSIAVSWAAFLALLGVGIMYNEPSTRIISRQITPEERGRWLCVSGENCSLSLLWVSICEINFLGFLKSLVCHFWTAQSCSEKVNENPARRAHLEWKLWDYLHVSFRREAGLHSSPEVPV